MLSVKDVWAVDPDTHELLYTSSELTQPCQLWTIELDKVDTSKPKGKNIEKGIIEMPCFKTTSERVFHINDKLVPNSIRVIDAKNYNEEQPFHLDGNDLIIDGDCAEYIVKYEKYVDGYTIKCDPIDFPKPPILYWNLITDKGENVYLMSEAFSNAYIVITKEEFERHIGKNHED